MILSGVLIAVVCIGSVQWLKGIFGIPKDLSWIWALVGLVICILVSVVKSTMPDYIFVGLFAFSCQQ